MWNFGSYSLVILVSQVVTGIALAMHYVGHIDLAFNSVEHIMRDVNNGWLLRYAHANGASMFFIAVYTHIGRGLFYNSYLYPREFTWLIGVVIVILMILTAFMGYVLPWGQMSFWGATVITNLFSAVPKIGNYIVIWLWGGYAIDYPTLTRFFSLHYLVPFVLVALVLLHVIFLHEGGSNNPLGISFSVDSIAFTPYYTWKDAFGLFGFLAVFSSFLFFLPNTLGHPDNYVPANPMVTPAHIVPEWYFLPFYAILRSIPDKLGGVIGLAFCLLILFVLPFLINIPVRDFRFAPVGAFFFWFFAVDVLLLGWIGGQPVKALFVLIGQLLGVYYFSYFLFILNFVMDPRYYLRRIRRFFGGILISSLLLVK